MRVFVTGASGFIGGVLCAQLLERGHDVDAMVRRPGSEPPGTRAIAGDLGDDISVHEALAESMPDCVIHLAAEIASQRSQSKLDAVNVKGTESLISATLIAAGPNPLTEGRPRFVFASTVVTGEAHGELLTEETPLPVRTPYGRSKQSGERLLLDAPLPSVIVRPSHVYGPGGWYVDELIAQLRRPGRMAVIGDGANLWDVVHVHDVAGALVLAAEDAPAGSIYHVADDQPITFYDFMALTAAELGLGAPRRAPAALARLIAGKNAVDAATRSARSSNAKIKRELGWEPMFPTAQQGVADAVRELTLSA